MPEGTLADKIVWHQAGVIPALSSWVPHAPAELDEVFQKMLARDPAHRWGNCHGLIKALERLERFANEPDETIPIGRLIEEETERPTAETQAAAEVTPVNNPIPFSLDASGQPPPHSMLGALRLH